jgi:hypothetical protein
MPQKWLDGHLKTYREGQGEAENKAHQANLARFLEVDLETAFTFLSLAATEADIDPDASQRALGKARTALRSVRRFIAKIEDAETVARIRARADTLESELTNAPH